MNLSEYNQVRTGGLPRADEETYSFYLNHQIPILDDRVTLDSAIRYSDNSGGREWSRLQISSGFNYTF